MNGTIQAAREEHDKELEAMEAEIAKAGGAEPAAPVEPAEAHPAEETETPVAEPAPAEPNEPPVEETPAPAPKPTGQPSEEPEELTEEEVQALSGKAQKRFGNLSKENIRLKKENEFLRKHMKEPEEPQGTEVPEPSTPRTRLPWDTTPSPEGEEEEMTAEQVRLEARKEALVAVAEERRQERIMSNLEADSKEISEKYPELNADSELYDPTLVTKISVWYKAQFKENNDLRLKDFVTELMAIRAQGEERGRSEVDETIARQAADQAITPTAPSGKTSDTVVKKIQGAKSIEELEAMESQI